MTAPSPSMRESEVAAFLGISPKTLQKWRWQGRNIPYRKRGSAVVYSRADVEAYDAATKVEVSNQ